MKKTTSCSIVVPAYNTKNTIIHAMKACLSQSIQSEIIIVDDGSADRIAEIVKQYPVRYIYQENAGPAAARNTGWKAASGEIVFFTDSDCVPGKDWIKKILSHYTSDEIGAVGGSYDIQNKDSLLARCIHEEIMQRHGKIPTETNFLGSFNVSYRRCVLEKVGGFNTSFRTASGEDNELAYKVRKAGYKLIFDKDARVAHFHTTKLIKYLREQSRHGYWRMRLYRLHPGMATGDGYAGIFDLIQPPLAMVTIGLLVVGILFRSLLYVASVLLVILLLMQLPMTVKVAVRNRNVAYLYFIPMLFMRAFARGWGMTKGVMKFFVLGAICNEKK